MMHIFPSFFGCQVHRFNLTAVSYDYQSTTPFLPPYQDKKKQYFHKRDLKKKLWNSFKINININPREGGVSDPGVGF